jgi:tetratricopeptide (TPR) repeat protein
VLSAPAADPGRGRLLVAGATLLAAAAVASAGLPAWSSGRTDAAADTAAKGTPQALQDAAAKADLASRLDPLATRPLYVAAAIAEARGRLLDARSDLIEAVDRQPDDPTAWVRLAGLAQRLADRGGLLRAARRASELDPANPFTFGLYQQAIAATAPPGSSATATGTPLPGAPPPAP